MVQGGDIVKNDGTNGESIYGPYFDDENSTLPVWYTSEPRFASIINSFPTNSFRFSTKRDPLAWRILADRTQIIRNFS